MYTLAQRCVGVPNVKVFVVFGKMLLLTSALNTTLSVFALPNVISPSAVILPVACKLPKTSTFELKLTVPVPPAVISKLVLVPVDATVLPLICNWSTTIVPWYTTGLTPAGDKLIVEEELDSVLFKKVNVAS